MLYYQYRLAERVVKAKMKTERMMIIIQTITSEIGLDRTISQYRM